jgi:hypothetical protein
MWTKYFTAGHAYRWPYDACAWHLGTQNYKHTHSEYVILIAFPLQQWLHECASLLRYTYITPCVRWSLRFFSVWKRIRKFNPCVMLSKFLCNSEIQTWLQVTAITSTLVERSNFKAQHRDADGGDEYSSIPPTPPLQNTNKQTRSKRFFFKFCYSCSLLLVLL